MAHESLDTLRELGGGQGIRVGIMGSAQLRLGDWVLLQERALPIAGEVHEWYTEVSGQETH